MSTGRVFFFYSEVRIVTIKFCYGKNTIRVHRINLENVLDGNRKLNTDVISSGHTADHIVSEELIRYRFEGLSKAHVPCWLYKDERCKVITVQKACFCGITHSGIIIFN